jgi:hypothetical protein
MLVYAKEKIDWVGKSSGRKMFVPRGWSGDLPDEVAQDAIDAGKADRMTKAPEEKRVEVVDTGAADAPKTVTPANAKKAAAAKVVEPPKAPEGTGEGQGAALGGEGDGSGSEGSGTDETGAGGAPTAKPLESMLKADLIVLAREKGVEVSDDMLKADIVEKLKAANVTGA